VNTFSKKKNISYDDCNEEGKYKGTNKTTPSAMIVVQPIFKNDKNPCLKSPPTIFLPLEVIRLKQFSYCCVSLARSPDSNRRRTPVYTYLHFKLIALSQNASAIPNPYALENCSLLRLPIPKSLIKNELYVDNFIVNIQHYRPVEKTRRLKEIHGDKRQENVFK
jgi:hypothetical protein